MAPVETPGSRAGAEEFSLPLGQAFLNFKLRSIQSSLLGYVVAYDPYRYKTTPDLLTPSTLRKPVPEIPTNSKSVIEAFILASVASNVFCHFPLVVCLTVLWGDKYRTSTNNIVHNPKPH